MKDLYQILGIERSVSSDAIREAYVARMRVVHPDRFNPTSDEKSWKAANRLAAELNEAYAVLRNPESRRSYDQGLAPSISTHISERCPKCSSETHQGARFCHSCGQSLKDRTDREAAKSNRAAYSKRETKYLQTKCPKCGYVQKFDDMFIGKNVNCRRLPCGFEFSLK